MDRIGNMPWPLGIKSIPFLGEIYKKGLLSVGCYLT